MNKITDRYSAYLICLILSFLVLAVFWPLTGYDFINYDDPEYVTSNPYVRDGLTFSGVVWAFTAGHASNWHPLTWLSHMVDCQIYGLAAGGHHLTNILLHIANTLLLFLLLSRSTGSLWCSAFVAALFGLHPLSVESVAWVSERKNLLSVFWGLLTIGAYFDYVKTASLRRYLGVFILFSCALMTKPMLVTLPFVLLLLDYWPLCRQGYGGQALRFLDKKIIIEKVPLFVLSGVSSIITLVVQKSGGSVIGLGVIGPLERLSHSCVFYIKYLANIIFPSKLALLYPHPFGSISVLEIVFALLLLITITFLTVWFGRQYKYLLVGWLWFLGSLIPVIGIVQVGRQGIADRYTYLPCVGIFIICSWGFCQLAGRWRSIKVPMVMSSILILFILAMCSWGQVHYWQDSLTVYQRTLAVTKDNAIAHYNYANALYGKGRLDKAIFHYKQALQIEPDVYTYNNLGCAFMDMGDFNGAVQCFRAALAIDPDFANALKNLAEVQKQLAEK
ncbi:tetratricopeptide repeat protein [Candidatus Pacearchaeota archaeon]|nr:tetratricopeptide repeat protein [Candidatus Pacearchaeota archaeon]